MPFFGFWFLGLKKKFHPNESQLAFHMGYLLFLHYEWFLLNLEKDFVRTNVHTTVNILTFLEGTKRIAKESLVRTYCLESRSKNDLFYSNIHTFRYIHGNWSQSYLARLSPLFIYLSFGG